MQFRLLTCAQVSSLNFFKVRDSELAWIEADVRVEAADAAQAAKRAVHGDLVPTLDVPRGECDVR
jgi:hypothetical protein